MVEHFGDLAHVCPEENEEYVLINVKDGTESLVVGRDTARMTG